MNPDDWEDSTGEGNTIFEANGTDWDKSKNNPQESESAAGKMAGFFPDTDDWRYPNLGEDEIAGEGADRDDHDCFLIKFLSTLCLREASLRATGDDEGVAVVVEARHSFIEDHFGW